jgi:predicted DCC family thiol-disulfide oxidoreductase YuxK
MQKRYHTLGTGHWSRQCLHMYLYQTDRVWMHNDVACLAWSHLQTRAWNRLSPLMRKLTMTMYQTVCQNC